MKPRFSVLPALVVFLIAPAYAAGAMRAKEPKRPKRPTPPRVSIVVNKADNTLKLFQSGHPMRRYPVATGLYKCTPEGSFRVIQKSVLSGRGELGSHWIGLNTLGVRKLHRIGIHGTNNPASIGKWASKACVRMHNRHIREVYAAVPMGTRVRIINVIEQKHIGARPMVRRFPPWCPVAPIAPVSTFAMSGTKASGRVTGIRTRLGTGRDSSFGRFPNPFLRMIAETRRVRKPSASRKNQILSGPVRETW